MYNAAYTTEYVLYMQPQTHTDYTREWNTEKIILFYCKNDSILTF
jgi:hypothetical protein